MISITNTLTMNNKLAERVRNLWLRVARRHDDEQAATLQTMAVDLPFTNTRETCRLLLNRLEELNRNHAQLEPREKLRHLDAFDEPVDAVTERLHQITQDITLPVRPSVVETALDARKLYIELALGYKSVLNDISGDNAEIVDRDLPRIALEGGIDALSSVLQLSYALYWPTPSGVWKQLHELYQFAQRNGLAGDSTQSTDGVGTAYKKALLMWLANPYGLTPNEQYTTRQLVGQWAYLVEIVETEPEHSCFAILNGDSPPVTWQWHQANEPVQAFLSNHKLCAIIEQHEHDQMPLLAARMPAPLEFDANTVARRLAPDLIALWCADRKREYDRRQAAASKLMTVGLGASHYFLANRAQLGKNQSDQVRPEPESVSETSSLDQSVLPRSAVFHGKPSDTPSPYRIHSANVHRPSDHPLSPPPKSLISMPRMRTNDQPSLPLPQTFPKVLCRIINESSTGACLLIRGRQDVNLRVGELVTLFALGNENYRAWGIGAIRWLRHFQGEYLMVGIEKLVSQANAVATKVCDPSGKYSDYLRSLLVTDFNPGQKGKAAPTLITAHVPYRTGDTILMHYLGEEKRLILGTTVRSTSRFRQFTFEDPDALGLEPQLSASAANQN